MSIRWVVLFLGLMLAGLGHAATQYTYDSLNRLTKVVYGDGRSIEYIYDAAGNLLKINKTGVTADPSTRLEDKFDGSALDTNIWTQRGVNNCGGVVIGDGKVKFNGGTYADTMGKKAFAGGKIVVQAIMAGTGGNRDTHFELIDVGNGDRLQFGDTSYFSQGLYFLGTGRYNVPQRSYGQATTNAFKAYRLTVEGTTVKFERGDSVDGPMQGATVTLPASTFNRSFYLRIGTGAPDCVYSPGTFDWIKVSADPLFSTALVDDFNAGQLDASKWISAGYAYEPSIPNPPAGTISFQNGVVELGYAGGLASIGKHHFKGRKIVVEARIAKTGNGELPLMLTSLANWNDRILISDTSYCGVGFLGGAGGIFELNERWVVCGSSQPTLALGSPASAGAWMEYRLTVDGDRFTMERGPTLDNITQSATGTLGRSIEGHEFFLYFRTGSSGGYHGALYDWIRVRTAP